MKKQKTAFIWIILVLVILGIFTKLTSIWMSITTITTTSQNYLSLYAYTTLSLIGLVLSIIFIFNLSRVSKDLVMWAHIFFGYAIIYQIIRIVMFYTAGVYTWGPVPLVIFAIVNSILWFTFVRHLKS